MKVLIVRHAKAEKRTLLALRRKKDTARVLTPGGRRDMARVAKGLQQLVSQISILAASPLARAKETAQILAKRYDDMDVTELPLLSPGNKPEALSVWVRAQHPDATVALVGHEPDLAIFASYLLTGRGESCLQLKKAACCLIDLPDRSAAGNLEWLLPPGVMRKLG
ncbi:MAG: SixA phosphatase family protein [Sulfuricaulis sp.]